MMFVVCMLIMCCFHYISLNFEEMVAVLCASTKIFINTCRASGVIKFSFKASAD